MFTRSLKVLQHPKKEILDLEKEIDKGLKSPVSRRTHKEIFDKLRRKYEVC